MFKKVVYVRKPPGDRFAEFVLGIVKGLVGLVLILLLMGMCCGGPLLLLALL